jgi:hypothetical protein
MRFGNRFEIPGNPLRKVVHTLDTLFKAFGFQRKHGYANAVTSHEQINAWRLSNHQLQNYVTPDLKTLHYPM